MLTLLLTDLLIAYKLCFYLSFANYFMVDLFHPGFMLFLLSILSLSSHSLPFWSYLL